MPQVRLAQPWAPARRQQPLAVRATRPVVPTLGGSRVGQTTAQLWARGSDISFSILTGVAAIVSGIALVVNFGKGDPAIPPRIVPGMPPVPGRSATSGKPMWYVIGGLISVLGAANIWSSINRASAIQAASAPPAAAPPSGG